MEVLTNSFEPFWLQVKSPNSLGHTVEDIVACVYTVSLVKREGMIPFSGLSQFSGLFNVDGPSPLNRDTTVIVNETRESKG